MGKTANLFSCAHCGRSFPKRQSLQKHYTLQPICAHKRNERFQTLTAAASSRLDDNPPPVVSPPPLSPGAPEVDLVVSLPSSPRDPGAMDVDPTTPDGVKADAPPTPEPCRTGYRVTVEEVEDEEMFVSN